jgi:hypothetical protein
MTSGRCSFICILFNLRGAILGDGRLVRDSPFADFMGLAENHQAGSMGPPAEGETSSIEIF